VIINTHWAFTSMTDILEKTEAQKNDEPSKRKQFGNDIINLESHYFQYTNNINLIEIIIDKDPYFLEDLNGDS
jgi:hypothetical protein